ncbi:MAG TPA: NAD-dependent DNA ligase LigA [Opitutus sp.]|nr:NAD-dependent DNA ligase LigA [Opitutus sp.]
MSLVLALAVTSTRVGAARPDDPAERLRVLRVEVARHDELYFRQARSEISDSEYDALKRELTELQARFPGLIAGPEALGKTFVGDDRGPGFPKARHRAPMLSLEKAYTESELRAFVRRTRSALPGRQPLFLVEPKYDGLAVSAVYIDGKLARLVTRGDGEEGDDVIANAPLVAGLPAELRSRAGERPPALLEARGEVYMTLAEFDRINRERAEAGEPEFSSPRNLAAGTLKSRESAGAKDDARRLEVVFFAAGAIEPEPSRAISQADTLAAFRAWGLPAVEAARVHETEDQVWNAVQAIGAERGAYPFPTDGAVVKVNALADRDILGASGEAPRWAIAVKFSAPRARTRVRAIALQVGRTGQLTPVAELEPVRLGGATITRVNLHNAAEIARRDVRVGDFVYVERAGEIVPAVVGVDHAARPADVRPYLFPQECPSCAEPISAAEGEAVRRCLNVACPAQFKRRIRHFTSPRAARIRGLGEATVNALVDGGKLRNLADLYRLTREDLGTCAALSASRADLLLSDVEASRHAEPWRLVHGLGLPGVGEAGAKILAAKFGGLSGLAAAGEDELRERGGVSTESAAEIVRFFDQPALQDLLQQLRPD